MPRKLPIEPVVWKHSSCFSVFSMSHPRLPLELLYHTIQSRAFRKSGLSSISASLPLMRGVAQRAQFRHVGPVIVDTCDDELKTWPAELFFDAIISSPHRLALMVYSYFQTICRMECCGSMEQTLRVRHDQKKTFDIMSMTFKLMKNMKQFLSHQYNKSQGDTHSPRSLIDTV